MSHCGDMEPKDLQKRKKGGKRLYLKALIEDGERKEIKRDSQRFKEIVEKVEKELSKTLDLRHEHNRP